jgi:uncharacterized protein
VLSLSERREAIDRARRSIGEAVRAPSRIGLEVPEGPRGIFAEPRGVFVTLRRYPGDHLRGCIGYPLPYYPLATAIERAAAAAAVEDPRFRPVRPEELDHLTVEISVLSVPVPLRANDPTELIAQVKVGRDGLIVEGFGTSGLLLPQVAPEQGWNAEEFLSGTCEKAGLPPSAWRRPGIRVRRFEAEVFREPTPGGSPVDEPALSGPAARSEPRS